MNQLSFLNNMNIYYAGHEECEPGHSYGPAIRAHFLIHFVLRGKGEFRSGGSSYALKAGDAFLIYPGEYSYYFADQDQPWEYAWVAMDGYDVENILAECGFSINNPVFYGDKSPENAKRTDGFGDVWRNRILKMVDAFEDGTQNDLRLLGYFYLVFSGMLGNAQKEVHSQKGSYVKEACSYISHNYGYDIKIGDIARYIGIDRTYLYKVFMEKKGVSPQQYLIAYRVQAAANMLFQTKLNVTEVAYSCGFKDTPSFCRHFKKAVGLTPAQYRKRGAIELNILEIEE